MEVKGCALYGTEVREGSVVSQGGARLTICLIYDFTDYYGSIINVGDTVGLIRLISLIAHGSR
jgi:hypothetical protein